MADAAAPRVAKEHRTYKTKWFKLNFAFAATTAGATATTSETTTTTTNHTCTSIEVSLSWIPDAGR